MKSCWHRNVAAAATLLGALTLTSPTHAFARDSHYHLTFGLTLMTCFDWDEAHLIASADFMIDRNKTTKAEASLTKKVNKRGWHAFAHDETRLNELWHRAVNEPDQEMALLKFGQFLHFMQDWEAHAGYPLGIGHALATVSGNDPDSMAKDLLRTAQMAQATLDHLGKACAALGRVPEGVDADAALLDLTAEARLDQVVADLIYTSRPNWRSRWYGGLTKEGKRIVAANKLRIEKFIDQYVRRDPAKNVPAEFTPGDDELGIPSAIPMRFAKDGALLTDSEVLDLAAEFEPPPRDEVRLLSAAEEPGGWRIRLAVKNKGTTPFDTEGQVRFLAVDAMSEELVGETTGPIPALAPGDKTVEEVFIPTRRPAEETVIGVVAEVADLSPDHNTIWFMTDEAVDDLEETLESAGYQDDGTIDAPPVQTIEFVGDPRLFYLRQQEYCIVIRSRTNSNDPTREMWPADISLYRGDELPPIPLIGTLSRVWSIAATYGSRPLAKTYECLDPVEDLCPLGDWSSAVPELQVTLRADLTVDHRILRFDEVQHQGLKDICAGTTARLASPRRAKFDGPLLKVLTFNTWHGLRGERRTKLQGEDPKRKAERLEWQIEQIKALDPDVLLFQEVNKNSRQTKAYAEALGYDYIKKVTSCGVHIPPIKIPSNMNEGLAILARPGLGLRKVGKKRLSGNARCGANYGFQTKESRYVLFGEITIEGESVLVATTHLSSPPYLRDSFIAELDELVDEGVVALEQRDEIVAKIERKRVRNYQEADRIVEQFEKHRRKSKDPNKYRHLILGGDFNTEPDTLTITALRKVGFTNATTGPEFLTWDPVKNAENQSIAGRLTPPVPTFDIPEIEELLEPWEHVPRQIDFIFVGPSVTSVSAEMVLDEPRDGIYPSDHFGMLSVVRLGRTEN